MYISLLIFFVITIILIYINFVTNHIIQLEQNKYLNILTVAAILITVCYGTDIIFKIESVILIAQFIATFIIYLYLDTVIFKNSKSFVYKTSLAIIFLLIILTLNIFKIINIEQSLYLFISLVFLAFFFKIIKYFKTIDSFKNIFFIPIILLIITNCHFIFIGRSFIFIFVFLLTFLIIFIYNMNFALYTDPLTKTLNRFYIETHLNRYVSFLKYLVVIYIDVEDFKKFNDTLGHDVGDEVLITIGNLLNNNSQKVDRVCRIGGDEFIIVTQTKQINEINNYVDRIKEKLNEENEKNSKYHINLSIGYTYTTRKTDIKKIISLAEAKMYKDKINNKSKL